MKLLSTVLAVISLYACSEKQQASLSELKETIEQFNAAYVEGDTTKLRSMIADNYVHTNSSWKSFGKEKWLSYMKTRRDRLDQGIIEVLDYRMEEYSVEQFENTALVTARIVSQGLENGASFDKSFRVTNLWVYENGSWKRAAFHDTLIE